MAEPAGGVHFDLTANVAKYMEDMARARAATQQAVTGMTTSLGSASSASAKTATSTASLAQGFGKTASVTASLAGQLGAVGGQVGKVSSAVASLALTGFNPLALAITGAGIALTAIIKSLGEEGPKAAKAFTESIQSAAEEVKKLRLAGEVRAEAHRTGRPEKLVGQELALREQQADAQRAFDEFRRLEDLADALDEQVAAWKKLTEEEKSLRYQRGEMLKFSKQDLEAAHERADVAATRLAEELKLRDIEARKLELVQGQLKVEEQITDEGRSRQTSLAAAERAAIAERLDDEIALAERRAAQQRALAEAERSHRAETLDAELAAEERRLAGFKGFHRAEVEFGRERLHDEIAAEERRRAGQREFEQAALDFEAERRADEMAFEERGVLGGFVVEARVAAAELETLGDVGASVYQEMRSGFGEVFAAAILDAENLGEVLKRIALQMLQAGLVQTGERLFTVGVNAALGGFAGGGSFRVGGSGGVDSQLVAFKASPDERVTVTAPGQSMGVVIQNHVHNYARDVGVTQRTVEGPRGPEIHTLIEEVVSASVESGTGRISRALDRRGLPPRARRN